MTTQDASKPTEMPVVETPAAELTEAPATDVAPEAPINNGKSWYEISDRAPTYVAGRRIGLAEEETRLKEIELTEAEARSELIAGHIRPKQAV